MSEKARHCDLHTEHWLKSTRFGHDGRPHIQIKIDRNAVIIVDKRVPMNSFAEAALSLSEFEPRPIIDVSFAPESTCKDHREAAGKLNVIYGRDHRQLCGLN